MKDSNKFKYEEPVIIIEPLRYIDVITDSGIIEDSEDIGSDSFDDNFEL